MSKIFYLEEPGICLPYSILLLVSFNYYVHLMLVILKLIVFQEESLPLSFFIYYNGLLSNEVIPSGFLIIEDSLWAEALVYRDFYSICFGEWFHSLQKKNLDLLTFGLL